VYRVLNHLNLFRGGYAARAAAHIERLLPEF
jgi:fructosamine-3-kinase